MANSIDITERCLPALKTRGCAPAFLPFTAYSRLQASIGTICTAAGCLSRSNVQTQISGLSTTRRQQTLSLLLLVLLP